RCLIVKRIIVSLAVGLLTLIAFANVAAASGSWGYQPGVPEKLLK
ncbi:MAG: hypothetical protein PWP31_1178, partial [Clostridia bacterium]|nr:hypothetical protein [Clostridia bacterium]